MKPEARSQKPAGGMFHRVGNCFGVTLWSWGKRVELWTCFSEVEEHAHPGQHVEIVPLFGFGEFWRVPPMTSAGYVVYECVTIERKKWFRKFSIPAGWRHWFTLQHRPLIFLNITTGRSAADNFVTT